MTHIFQIKYSSFQLSGQKMWSQNNLICDGVPWTGHFVFAVYFILLFVSHSCFCCSSNLPWSMTVSHDFLSRRLGGGEYCIQSLSIISDLTKWFPLDPGAANTCMSTENLCTSVIYIWLRRRTLHLWTECNITGVHKQTVGSDGMGTWF